MQICQVLNDDVGNRHEHHNAKHQQDKDNIGNHLINLRQTFVTPVNKPRSYTVLLHKHMEAPVMPEFAGAMDGGDTDLQ